MMGFFERLLKRRRKDPQTQKAFHDRVRELV